MPQTSLDEARQIIVKKWHVKHAEKDGVVSTDVASKITYDFKPNGSIVYFHSGMEEKESRHLEIINRWRPHGVKPL